MIEWLLIASLAGALILNVVFFSGYKTSRLDLVSVIISGFVLGFLLMERIS